jgi:UDP-2,3-diacylglucosamine pyrophosphatase LpxH
MPRSEKLTERKLDKMLRSRKTLRLGLSGGRFALLSDLHLGNGRSADDFRANETALASALRNYLQSGYTLILLGDVEELWQFGRGEIQERYGPGIYSRLEAFGPGRILRISGNHDLLWQKAPGFPPPESVMARPVHAVILEAGSGLPPIFLTHGHQGSLMSDSLAFASYPFVRMYRYVESLWTGIIEHFGKVRAPSVYTRVRKDFELVMYSWAVKRRVMLVTGHSHRAVFMSMSYSERLRSRLEAWRRARERRSIRADPRASAILDARIGQAGDDLRKEEARDGVNTRVGPNAIPCFFNTGCGLFEQGITALEIDAARTGDWVISLVKWSKEGKRKAYREANLERLLRSI